MMLELNSRVGHLPGEEEPGTDHRACPPFPALAVHGDDIAGALVHPGLDGRAEGEHGGEAWRLVVLEWEAGDPVGEPIEPVLIFRAKVKDLGGVSACVTMWCEAAECTL